MFLGLQVTVFRFDPGGDTIQPLITRRIPNFPSIVFTVYTVRFLIPGWLYLPTGGYLSCESLQLFSEARRYLDCAGSRELEKGWHSFKDEIPGTSTALQALLQGQRTDRIAAFRSLGAQRMVQLESELAEARITLFGPLPAAAAPPTDSNRV